MRRAVRTDGADELSHGGQEPLLDAMTDIEDAGGSTPLFVGAGEAAVVQFVADIQRQLQVEAKGVGVRERQLYPRQILCGQALAQQSDDDTDTGPGGPVAKAEQVLLCT